MQSLVEAVTESGEIVVVPVRMLDGKRYRIHRDRTYWYKSDRKPLSEILRRLRPSKCKSHAD